VATPKRDEDWVGRRESVRSGIETERQRDSDREKKEKKGGPGKLQILRDETVPEREIGRKIMTRGVVVASR
jgi:hypothetical protein